MDDDARLVEALRSLSYGNGPDIFPAIVKEVYDESIDVVSLNGSEFPEVRLKAAIDGKDGLTLKPVKGSSVIVGRLNRSSRLVVLLYSQVDEMNWCVNATKDGGEAKNLSIKLGKDGILIKDNDFSFGTTEEGFAFNGGELGGMVEIKKLVENLDNLKTFVEDMNKALPDAFNAIGAADLASGSNGGKKYTTSMTGKKIKFEDMEDTAVRH